MYTRHDVPVSFGEYLQCLKSESGLTWGEMANAVGLFNDNTMVKYVNGRKIPGWSTFLKLCAWGDQYGFSFSESVKAYLPKVYQNAQKRNSHLILQAALSKDFDIIAFARQNPQQLLSSAYALCEITDMCLLCIAHWKNSIDEDSEALVHCKELAQFVAGTRAAARKIIDFWHQNTPDSRERDIALQLYCFGVKDKDLAAIWKINTRWIRRLSDNAISYFLKQIGVSSQAGDSL